MLRAIRICIAVEVQRESGLHATDRCMLNESKMMPQIVTARHVSYEDGRPLNTALLLATKSQRQRARISHYSAILQ